MRIIKNSHSGVGGIATESLEMLKYVQSRPEHFLSLVHRDPNNAKQFVSFAGNTETNYLIVTKSIPEVIQGIKTIDDLRQKYALTIHTIEEIIDRTQPDIALCVGSFYYPWLLLEAAKKKQLPIAIRYAGIIEKEESEQIWHELGKEFVNPSFHYIFPSKHTKDTLESIHRTCLPQSAIIGNGICAAFLKDGPRPMHKKFRIAYVGRISPVKNPERCAQIADELKQAGIDAEFYCITDSCTLAEPDPYQALVLENMACNGIQTQGDLNHESLAQFYKNVDLILVPSHFETFCNVALEAVATGTPALINSTAGVKEVFYELGLAQLVTDFTNTPTIVRQIKELKKSGFVVEDDVRKRIAEHYSWQSVMDRYFAVLQDTFTSTHLVNTLQKHNKKSEIYGGTTANAV